MNHSKIRKFWTVKSSVFLVWFFAYLKPRPSNFNSYGTDRVYPPRDHMAVYCQKVNFGFHNYYRMKLTCEMNSWCFSHSICGLKMSISGSPPVKIPPENFFSENFYCTKSSAFKFQGESLELFFSYHVHFRRYRHFRVFWQSTASWSRRC